jgi:hypothetical protein
MKLSWKPRQWLALGALLASCCAVIAIGVVEHNAAQKAEVAALLPEGALLSIEADDFSSLLHDWNSSAEKRAWIKGDNYAAFSRSRLFERLAQAQGEFSEVAAIDTGPEMLEAIAGKQSGLALYDIGKLEFVYITRMDAGRAQSLPLWQARDKFERRSEAGSDFYLRKDAKTGREASFALRDGWLILGTRQDLVAGVLDRIAGKSDHNLGNEAWYAEAIKQAGERGELRMALDLAHIVPSPYFRSYWVQRNITGMKQYVSAVSDLRRDGLVYREERVLLRHENSSGALQGDAQALFQIAPEDAALAVAQVPGNAAQVLAEMREDLLELRPAGAHSRATAAPAAAGEENAGTAAQLDVDLSQAPMVEARTDLFQPLLAVLNEAEPLQMLRCYESPAPQDDLFVDLHAAMVLQARNRWNEDAVRNALTGALASGATVNKLGAQWVKRSGSAGDYLALDGALPLFLKLDGQRLFLSTDAALMEKLLGRAHGASSPASNNQTYLAVFRTAQARPSFLQLTRQLARAGGNAAAPKTSEDEDASTPMNGAAPLFLSGNIASLSKAFARLDSEEVAERDLGATVRQSVTYRWKQ